MTFQDEVLNLITDPKLTFRERIIELSKAAANQLDIIEYSDATRKMIDQ